MGIIRLEVPRNVAQTRLVVGEVDLVKEMKLRKITLAVDCETAVLTLDASPISLESEFPNVVAKVEGCSVRLSKDLLAGFEALGYEIRPKASEYVSTETHKWPPPEDQIEQVFACSGGCWEEIELSSEEWIWRATGAVVSGAPRYAILPNVETGHE